MDFNIRAISLVESISRDARIEIPQLIGKEIHFRAGLRYSLTLPNDQEQFERVPSKEQTLTALHGWSRVFGYRLNQAEIIHVLASSEDENGDLTFYRVDLVQPVKPRKGPRPAVEITGGAVMNFEECADWLIDLAQLRKSNSSQRNLWFVLRRPCELKLTPAKVAWIIPSAVEGKSVGRRLESIGEVYGAEIVHVEPRGYRDTQARLAKNMPFDAVVICSKYAPHISADAVPDAVHRNLIHVCESTTLVDLESQIRIWIEISIEEVEKRRLEKIDDEESYLLALMVRNMLKHHKIGEFNHCQKQTVLKCVKARHLNVPAAEGILDRNSEAHRDNHESDQIFLWKDHNDGRQYFLNPRKVESLKSSVTQGSSYS